MSAHPLKIRNLWPALCLAVASWMVPDTASAASWIVTADEAGTITHMDLSEPTQGNKQRQIRITVTPELTPSQATVTVEGDTRPATDPELRFFWMDRGALAAAWDHYLEDGRLKLSLIAVPPKDVVVPRENRRLIPKKGKLPEALHDKTARVTLYNNTTLIGTIMPGAEETEFLLRIADSKIKISVSAVQAIYLLAESEE